jgi:hypothetical protein
MDIPINGIGVLQDLLGYWKCVIGYGYGLTANTGHEIGEHA